MAEQQAPPIFVRYGAAKKSVFEMSDEEFKEASNSSLRRAKEKAFSKGLPIYFSEHGKIYAEYADGRIEELKKS